MYFTRREMDMLDRIVGKCASLGYHVYFSFYDDHTVDISIYTYDCDSNIYTKTHSIEVGLESALDQLEKRIKEVDDRESKC